MHWNFEGKIERKKYEGKKMKKKRRKMKNRFKLINYCYMLL